MIDTRNLMREIHRNQLTVPQFCRKLGISCGDFREKCHGQQEFTYTELNEMVRLLRPADPQAIFFGR